MYKNKNKNKTKDLNPIEKVEHLKAKTASTLQIFNFSLEYINGTIFILIIFIWPIQIAIKHIMLKNVSAIIW